MRTPNVANLYAKLYEKQIGFLGKYYDAKIIVNPGNSSYFNMNTREIIVGFGMLERLMNNNRVIRESFHSFFYTLLLHEVGHALYTSEKISDRVIYSNEYSRYDKTLHEIHNILEDNRIERKLSERNGMQKFNLLRYAIFDKNAQDYLEMLKNDPLAIVFGTRFHNSEVIKTAFKYELNKDQRDVVDKIYSLEKEFRYIDDDENERLIYIVKEIFELLKEFIHLDAKNQQEQEKSEGGSEGEPQEHAKSKNNDSGSAEEQEEVEQTLKQVLEQLLDEEKDTSLKEAKFENEEFKKTPLYKEARKTYILNNDVIDYKKNDYEKYPIFLDSFKRNKGIKGTGKTPRYSGSIQDLNLRRYARRGFERDVKPFDRASDDVVGQDTRKIIFYLDMSGSMGHNYSMPSRAKSLATLVAEYVKNFYDRYNKELEIEIRGFNDAQYILSRKELDNRFFKAMCNGRTKPYDFTFDPKKEKVIVMTDGEFHTENWQISNLLKHAIFVVIAHEMRKDFNELNKMNDEASKIAEQMENKDLYERYKSIVPNNRLVLGTISTVRESFNEATKKIARNLQI